MSPTPAADPANSGATVPTTRSTDSGQETADAGYHAGDDERQLIAHGAIHAHIAGRHEHKPDGRSYRLNGKLLRPFAGNDHLDDTDRGQEQLQPSNRTRLTQLEQERPDEEDPVEPETASTRCPYRRHGVDHGTGAREAAGRASRPVSDEDNAQHDRAEQRKEARWAERVSGLDDDENETADSSDRERPEPVEGPEPSPRNAGTT